MKTYDAIVIGSGATGGWAAKQLCEGGMEVLMLDAGRMIDPSKEFQEHTWPYQLPFRGFGKPGDIEVRQRSASRFAGEFTTQFYVNDADLPYTTPQDKPFNWIRARNVGGRTLAWGRQTYRLSNYDLQAASHDGFGQNWPLRYEDLAPYYDIVESFIGVSGRAEGYEALPDGKFLPPMNFSCGEMQLKKVVDAYGDRIMTIGRAAILTERHEGRAAC
jgi:choline dehydrogenase-like flavoprotein